MKSKANFEGIIEIRKRTYEKAKIKVVEDSKAKPKNIWYGKPDIGTIKFYMKNQVKQTETWEWFSMKKQKQRSGRMKKNTGTAENRRQWNRRNLPTKIIKVVHVSRKIKWINKNGCCVNWLFPRYLVSLTATERNSTNHQRLQHNFLTYLADLQ